MRSLNSSINNSESPAAAALVGDGLFAWRFVKAARKIKQTGDIPSTAKIMAVGLGPAFS